MANILKTTNLTKKYGAKVVLNNVNMSIDKGDIYGFVGKNGAGKTTLMRIVLGMAHPTQGTYQLFGGENEFTARERIGSLIEYPVIYDKNSAYENMKRFSILFGGTDEQIYDILKFVGLGDVANKKAGKYSLGMKQRLGIGIAMLAEPEFMILDEPVNGLDPAGIKEVRDLILKLNKEKNVTFLISSHLLDELSKIVTKYGFIDNGNLVEEVTAKELQERFTKKLVINVDDTVKAKEMALKYVEEKDVSVVDNFIILESHVDESGKINKALVESGVTVNTIIKQSENLEQYFMEKVGY